MRRESEGTRESVSEEKGQEHLGSYSTSYLTAQSYSTKPVTYRKSSVIHQKNEELPNMEKHSYDLSRWKLEVCQSSLIKKFSGLRSV